MARSDGRKAKGEWGVERPPGLARYLSLLFTLNSQLLPVSYSSLAPCLQPAG